MNEITFEPKATNIIRYYLIISLISVPVAVGLVTFLITRSSSTNFSWKDSLLFWLATSSAAILGGLLVRFLLRKKLVEVHSITVSARHIVGPRGWRRKSFEIGRLDRGRSRHRNLYQRLVRWRSLRFRDGDELEICDAFYGEEQIKTLLEKLQLKN
jgi:hypothetical protein